MVTDDPFHEPDRVALREARRPSPILRVAHSTGDLTQSPEAHDQAPPVAAASGARTPRRVQWNQDHIVNLHPLQAEESRDSQLTHHNLDDVNDALERFRQRRNAPSTLSMASAASSATGDTDGYPPRGNTEDDYDYRLDRDPPEEHKEDDSETLYEHEILDSGINDVVTTYVPPGETDGLPSMPSESQNKADDTAADLVRRHTSKWGNLRHRVKSGSVRKRAAQAASSSVEPGLPDTNEKDESRRFSEDHEPPRNAPLNPPLGADMPHIPGGTSVLSSLLALYGRHNMPGSSGTTPASSRPPSIGSIDSTDDEKLKQDDKPNKRKLWQRKGTVPPNSQATPDEVNITDFDHKHRSKSLTSIADRDSQATSPGLKGTFQRAAHTWRQGDRPKAARSDAGVFGALIGSTGSMGAAAAPNSSTLIPAPKRPGYHLSRYSLGAERDSKPNSRPNSFHSSTAAEVSLDDLSRPKSTDDMVVMKKKKPSALHLVPLGKAEKWIAKSVPHTPPEKDYSRLPEEERRRKEYEAEKRKRRKAKEARKKQEVFIIQHVAAILARQQFILKLARALMMFGSPTHRLETQIQATARVLEINAQVVYLPGTMLVSFGDDATHTSETKFLKQTTGLDLGKLLEVHNVYWNVVHDRVSVDEANKDLDRLMTMKPHYNAWQTFIVGMFCSAFIVVPSFYGSFLDALMAAPLGGALVLVQMLAAKNDMFSNVFEITIATLISFIAAVLASSSYFCYTALVSGGVVLILPGYIVLTGALELASRNITAGAVRIGYSVIYSLFLGFGISIGAEIYGKIRGKGVRYADDWQCAKTHLPGSPWYMQTPSGWWYYLCVPGYSFVLSLRNQQPIFRKELPVMMATACAGWVVNHFSAQAFPGRSDIVSAIGAFTVGILGNFYGRFLSNGASFPVMVTGILMQLPSGLSQGGIFNFAAAGSTTDENGNEKTTDSTRQYSTGFSVAEQLVSVAIGLTVGLFVAAVVTHPFGGSRRRGAGIFSF